MELFYNKGGRKSSTARAYLRPTDKKRIIQINKKPLEEYLRDPNDKATVLRPFSVIGDKIKQDYDVLAFVKGGGTTGQSGAICNAIARALCKADHSLRKSLKTAGLLSRDSRSVQPKKPGFRKSRKKSQWTKR